MTVVTRGEHRGVAGARLGSIDQRFRLRDCLRTAAVMSVMVPIIASIGSWLAVRGNRVLLAESACMEVPAAVVAPAAGVTLTAGTDGVAMASDDDAIWPSWVVPAGAEAVVAALASTVVSCPLEPTRINSVVLVCSVVVV